MLSSVFLIFNSTELDGVLNDCASFIPIDSSVKASHTLQMSEWPCTHWCIFGAMEYAQ